MLSRRDVFLGATVLAVAAAASPASAFTFQPYDPASVQKAIAAGKKVVVHVYAPWCLQCRTQASILSGLEADHTYDNVAFFRVDYDNQGDIVKALGVPRSTLIGYKGGHETGRMSWGMSTQSVLDVLKTVV